MTVKGIVLAGGLGTRFRPLTNYVQKCMIPIGDKEKPILEYIIKLYKYHNINDLVLLVGYKFLQIENYFDHGERFGVNLSYIEDKPGWKGSANAILNAYNEGAFTKEDTLIIYYGDIVSNINLAQLLKHHKSTEAKATVALTTGLRINEGTADVEGDWIKAFKEKPMLDTKASIGILVLDGSVIEDMEKLQSAGQFPSFDLMGDVIQYMVEQKEKVAAYLTSAFWYDVGSIERYERLSNERLSEELGYLL
ncbi:nucleotidyltransferase family protein [Candidatus Bathyarchaeota archaeon]|nr:nucleotidyltransferase family protein [Candidatus Bathyarchaeota archaeon]